MRVELTRNKKGEPMVCIDIYTDFRIITEEQYKRISDLVDKEATDENGDEIAIIYLMGKKNYPEYHIGEYIIYIDRGDYLIGIITKKSEAVENCYYVDFNDGTCKWIEAEYLHKIANGDTYVFLV